MLRPRGETNPVTVLLVIGLVIAGWWGVVFGPLYLEHLDAKEAVWLAFNQAQSGASARDVQEQLLRTLNGSIGKHFQLDAETGAEQEQPGLGLEAEAVTVRIEPETNFVGVRVEYDRVVVLKPSKRRTSVHFVANQSGKIK